MTLTRALKAEGTFDRNIGWTQKAMLLRSKEWRGLREVFRTLVFNLESLVPIGTSPRIRAFEVKLEWRREWDAYRTFWLLNPETTLLDSATV
jgi:hypothetical protein